MQRVIWADFVTVIFKRLRILEQNIVQGLTIYAGILFKALESDLQYSY